MLVSVGPRARWVRWFVGLVVVLVVGYAVAAVVSLLFFPVEPDGPQPTPVTVSTTLTLTQP